ncbi:MAG: hypothetical protein ROO71_04425 [Balneola sp.]
MIIKKNTIRSKEDALFDEWSEKYPSFVRDGVISENAYENSKLKILLILKEVNDKGGGGWDLRNYVSEKPRGMTWNMVSYWVKGILDLEKSFDWKCLKETKKSDRAEYLQSIAVMNLKKTPGGGSSDEKEIREFTQDDREYLSKQFNLYNSDIVICCGTGKFVKEIIEVDWKKTTRGIKYGEFENNKYIYSFYHPQARYPNHFKYYMLIDAIKELQQ